MITVLPIKNNYKENIQSKYIKISPNDYINLISDISTNVSYYEILHDNCKLYFDIENISSTDSNLINDIISDLIKFINNALSIDIAEYTLTINKNSAHHSGLSYHLIFHEYYSTQENIKSILLKFLEAEGYQDYFDLTVYSNNRLFKSVNQINILQKGGRSTENDKHTIIYGSIDDSIITDIRKSKLIQFEQVKKLKQNRFKDIDDELFGLAFGYSLQDITKLQKSTLTDIIIYYNEHSSFDNYKFNRTILKSILKTFEVHNSKAD